MSNCNNNYVNDCTPCKEATPCGCSHKLSTLCVIYEGLALGNLNIVTGQNLETILTNLDNLIYTISQATELGWGGTNVGGNAEVYKGENLSGIHEFRTIKAGSNITVTQNGTDIEIASTAGSSGEVNTASNVGGGVESFKQKSGYDLQFRTFTGSNGINVTQVGDTIDIDGSSISAGSGEVNTASNLGTGEGIFKQKVGYDLQFKKIRAGSNISFVAGVNDIEINASTSGEMNVQSDWNETNTSSDAYILNKPNIPERLVIDIGAWSVATNASKHIEITSLLTTPSDVVHITSIKTLIYTDYGGELTKFFAFDTNTINTELYLTDNGTKVWIACYLTTSGGIPLPSQMSSITQSRGRVVIEF